MGGGHPAPPQTPCVTYSPSVVSSRGPGQSTVYSSPSRCSVDLLPNARQAAVLTPSFLFLHRQRVVVVKTFRIHAALTFARPPDRWCGTRAAGPRWRSRQSAPAGSLKRNLALTTRGSAQPYQEDPTPNPLHQSGTPRPVMGRHRTHVCSGWGAAKPATPQAAPPPPQVKTSVCVCVVLINPSNIVWQCKNACFQGLWCRGFPFSHPTRTHPSRPTPNPPPALL